LVQFQTDPKIGDKVTPTPTTPERGKMAPRESGDLETWESGDLPGAPRAPSKRTINWD